MHRILEYSIGATPFGAMNEPDTDTPRPAILLVEDNPHDTVLIRLAFRKLGIIDPIMLVKNGYEAMKYLSGEGVYGDRQLYPFPTLVLLDLKMPGTSGFEVLSWIRRQPPLADLAVVVMTGSSDTEDIRRATSLGADSYLVKPSKFSDLVQMMHSLKEYWSSSQWRAAHR